MDTDREPQFGEALPGVTYIDRPGVYALAIQDGLLLVVETASGFFLPGGGVDAGESLEDALRRELHEEARLSITGMVAIGTARQYVVDSQTGVGYNKIEHFYRVMITDRLDGPVETDHAVRWLAIEDARTSLREPAQAWAVSVAFPTD